MNKEELKVLLAYKMGMVDGMCAMEKCACKSRKIDKEGYYLLQQIRCHYSKNIDKLNQNKILNKINYIEHLMKCEIAYEKFVDKVWELEMNNIDSYIKFFKECKKYINYLFELDQFYIIDDKEECFYYDTNGLYFYQIINSALSFYDRFIKKYKTHEKVLKENGLSDIPDFLKKAYEIGKKHYKEDFKD